MTKIEQTGITIRPVQQSDFTEMFKLRKKLFQEELQIAGVPLEVARRHTKGWSLEGAVSSWEPWLTDSAWRLTAVTKLGKLAGMFIGSYDLASSGDSELASRGRGNYVSSIQLHPAIRRKGVGKALMEDFTQAGDPHEPTYLHVLENNLPARNFYQALGFTAISTHPFNVAGSFPLNKILLRKDAEAA